jgi:hypothetical protein
MTVQKLSYEGHEGKPARDSHFTFPDYPITRFHFSPIRLVSRVVGMSFQDSQGAIDLLQQHHPRQLMGQRHFPQ